MKLAAKLAQRGTISRPGLRIRFVTPGGIKKIYPYLSVKKNPDPDSTLENQPGSDLKKFTITLFSKNNIFYIKVNITVMLLLDNSRDYKSGCFHPILTRIQDFFKIRIQTRPFSKHGSGFEQNTLVRICNPAALLVVGWGASNLELGTRILRFHQHLPF